MSLNNNSYYNFYTCVVDVVKFLSSNKISLYDIPSMINSQNPNNSYLKIYVNHPNDMVTAHKPVCPDKPELITGFGNATENGFWIGMLRKQDIDDLNGLLANLAKNLKISKSSRCQRCGV